MGFGTSFGWFFDHNGVDLSAYPHITKIDKEGSGFQSGLRRGDVILEVKGEKMRSSQAVPRLKEILGGVKAGEAITVKVGRINGRNTDPFSILERKQEKTLKVKTSVTQIAEDQVGITLQEWMKKLEN